MNSKVSSVARQGVPLDAWLAGRSLLGYEVFRFVAWLVGWLRSVRGMAATLAGAVLVGASIAAAAAGSWPVWAAAAVAALVPVAGLVLCLAVYLRARWAVAEERRAGELQAIREEAAELRQRLEHLSAALEGTGELRRKLEDMSVGLERAARTAAGASVAASAARTAVTDLERSTGEALSLASRGMRDALTLAADRTAALEQAMRTRERPEEGAGRSSAGRASPAQAPAALGAPGADPGADVKSRSPARARGRRRNQPVS